jgi:hypothetical protein
VCPTNSEQTNATTLATTPRRCVCIISGCLMSMPVTRLTSPLLSGMHDERA